MKYLKLVLFLLLVSFSNDLYSQSIRLSESKQARGLQVFLMPGKSPDGEKLFQFSFTKFKKLNDNVRADSLILSTSSGKQLSLSNPKKLINGEEIEKGKQWFSTFSLNQEETNFVKNETISEMYVLVNNKQIKFIFPDSSRIELHDLLANHF